MILSITTRWSPKLWPLTSQRQQVRNCAQCVPDWQTFPTSYSTPHDFVRTLQNSTNSLPPTSDYYPSLSWPLLFKQWSVAIILSTLHGLKNLKLFPSVCGIKSIIKFIVTFQDQVNSLFGNPVGLGKHSQATFLLSKLVCAHTFLPTWNALNICLTI